MKRLLPLLLAAPLALTSCEDVIDKGLPDAGEDYGWMTRDDKGAAPVDSGTDVPDTKPPDKDQCKELWAAKGLQSSGVARHPVLSADGVVSIASGESLLRIGKDGVGKVCDAPYAAPAGEWLGHPSQTPLGTFFVGSKKGRLFSINAKCKERWVFDLDGSVCKNAGKGCDAVYELREAPAIDGEDEIFVVDSRPSLHRVSDLPTGPYHQWWHFADDAPAVTPNVVFVGGDQPFLAFQTRQTVLAVEQSGAGRWVFDDFKKDTAGPERAITSALAGAKGGKLLFVAGEVVGDTYENLKLYRLLPDSSDKAGKVDSGFPVPLGCTEGARGCKGLPLDTATGIAVGTDESIYVATLAHGVLRLASDGTELWRFIGDEESLRVRAVPALGDTQTLFFMAEPRFFYAVDVYGNRIGRFETGGVANLETTSPVIRDDGVILAHMGTEVRAFQCGNQKERLAVSSWPRYQGGNRSAGNLQVKN